MNQTDLRILLADDDEDDRMLFADAINEVKVKTTLKMANDGEQLMQYLHENQTDLPDIIFLDLNMPKKNGLECLVEIRKCEYLKHLSIAIYSTSNAEKDVEETFIKGANVYIRKPNSYTELKRVMKEVLTTQWQFLSTGLNKDTFLLNL